MTGRTRPADASYMVIVEEQHDQKPKGKGCENPLGIELPEWNQPAARLSWVERSADGHSSHVGRFQWAGDVRESYPEDGPDLDQDAVFVSVVCVSIFSQRLNAYRVCIVCQ